VTFPLKSRITLCVLMALAALAFATTVNAEPRLPHLFSDHMVLQRDREIHVWGWADPGEAVEVRFAGAARKTRATQDGYWDVLLPPFAAGGPFVLEVRANSIVRFKDVMVGEVWVASGQSNMTYALSEAATGAQDILKANDPELRFFAVPRRIAVEAQVDTLPASWQLCTSDTAKEFSAVAYYFARDLRRNLGVPVGVILSGWPGTAAEEWTDPDSLRRDAILQPIAARWDAVSADVEAYAAHAISLEFDDFELLPANAGSPVVSFSNFDDGSSRVSTGGSWSYSWLGAPESVFELAAPGRGGRGYSAKISGELDGTNDARWAVKLRPDGTPVDLSGYAGLRFWVRGNGAFTFRTLQPSITDWDDYGTEMVKATREWRETRVWFKDVKQAGWGVKQKLTLEQISGFAIEAMTPSGFPPRPPSGLYEGMITPLMNYRMRGAIWYQGESNTQRAFQYRTLLPAMIRSWRVGWQEGDFPFLIVQLPNQGHSEEFADSWWAELREAQLFTAKTVPNTGLAVTIDVGESWNLHPPRKQEVGERLALWALGTTYGEKVAYAGPFYESKQVQGREVRIRFQDAGGGLEAHGETLMGFTIAGADKKFHRGLARIEGSTVVVSSPEVKAPVAVRYAWGDSPECNLFNNEGLPASPFRTDDWPGATFGNR
jgi:sialate O-acetylesterase